MGEIYNSKNLHALVQKSGLSRDKIAELTGVPSATLQTYMRENPATPNLKHLTRLADFFAVPLDFIVGRCDKELAENILNDYGRYFMEIRRAAYEVYLDGRKSASGTTYDATEGEAPWPYNLMGAVLGKEKERQLISEDQEAGIMEALGTLDIRHEGFVLAYYRDGLNLKKIADLHEVSPEWVRQAIADALRRLRHPSRCNYLIYGKEGVKAMAENTIAKAELAKQEIELASAREKLGAKYTQLLSMEGAVLECSSNIADCIKLLQTFLGELSDGNTGNALYDMPIGELELPTRIFNCLKRRGCQRFGDVLKLAELGELMEIVGLGENSVQIILAKVRSLTGKDLSKANGLSNHHLSL